MELAAAYAPDARTEPAAAEAPDATTDWGKLRETDRNEPHGMITKGTDFVTYVWLHRLRDIHTEFPNHRFLKLLLRPWGRAHRITLAISVSVAGWISMYDLRNALTSWARILVPIFLFYVW
jgi:hypothetical protein